jgi:hypothetical protein
MAAPWAGIAKVANRTVRALATRRTRRLIDRDVRRIRLRGGAKFADKMVFATSAGCAYLVRYG